MKFNYPVKEVPGKYRNKIGKGRIEKFFYNTATEGEQIEKHGYVYLPDGYTKDKEYNIFYFLHGGGDGAESYFYGEGREGLLENMLDWMIEEKLMEPMIVVTPTFYTGKKDKSVSDAHLHVAKFHNELVEDLIPAVESLYGNYKEKDGREWIEKTRKKRAYGGFSMGSASCWYTFIHCLDCFKYFMPLSGDCWAVCEYGGGKEGYKTACLLGECVKKSKYKDDFFIYAFTGTDDIAYEGMKSQLEEMAKLSEFDKKVFWNVKEGGIHRYESVEQYLYTALPLLFKE